MLGQSVLFTVIWSLVYHFFWTYGRHGLFSGYEFSPENSELIAEKIDTHEFDLELGEVIICGNGILKKISELPQTHIANIELHNIIADERTVELQKNKQGID